MKQRFRWLKHWNKLHEVRDVNNVFVTCCILHNILLQHDGYVEANIVDAEDSFRGRMTFKFCMEAEDCLEMVPAPIDVEGICDQEEEDLGVESERVWANRVEAIAVHQTYVIRRNQLRH